MDTLPNRDTVAAFEARLGRPLTSVLIWLLATALAIGAISVIITALRATFTALQPVLPSSVFTEWAYRGTLAVFVALGIYGFIVVMRKFRAIEDVIRTQSALNESARVEAQMNATLHDRMDTIAKRFEYIENKVGNELHDFLVDRMMEEQAARPAALPVPEPLTDEKKGRVATARRLLREAAAAAKSAEAAGGDLDKATNQAWLDAQIMNLIAEKFSFEVYDDFRRHQEGRRRKLEQHGKKSDGREALADDGAYLSKLADRLTFEDIDADSSLPPNFDTYLRRS